MKISLKMTIKYINRTNGDILFESPPAEKTLNFLYNNLVGKSTFLTIFKQKFVSELSGEFMDSAFSVRRIKPFVDSLNIDMSEAEKGIDEFKSFNDFFYRKLKANVRPVGEGLVSPGDGKILAFKNVSEVNHFYIKGEKFTLKEFLKNDELAEVYKQSSMVILRLAPDDYHRYHFPFDGIPSRSESIAGSYYSVSPIALNSLFANVFHENKKEICHLKTAGKGEMLIIPIGASMVGSIHSTYEPNKEVKKGEEMGYFAFGGSTIVLLFDSNSFVLDEDILNNTFNKLETKVRMGEKIGAVI